MNFATALTSLKTKSLPYLEKVKVYGEKALDFTAKQVATTPLFLKTEEEYNILASAKRSIFLAYDESHLEIKNKALMFPIWGGKAWMDNAELRFLSVRDNGDLAKTLNVKGPIEIRVHYEGTEYLHTNDEKEIDAWWANRCYKKDDGKEDITEISKDPLQTL